MTKIDGWPDDNKCLNIEEIIDPLVDIIYQAYKIEAYPNRKTPLKYDGPSIGPHFGALAVGHDAPEQFLPENVEYDDERGRDVLHIVLRVAIQLGMEQGRRIRMATSSGHALNYFKLLKSILDQYDFDNNDDELINHLLQRIGETINDE